MNLENLLFILFLAAIAFVNVVLPWLRRRAEAARRGRAMPAPADEGRAEEGDEDTTVASAAVQPGPPPAVLPVVSADVPRRVRAPAKAEDLQTAGWRASHAPLISLDEARRGIVLRTILGPCRAQEPVDGWVN